MPKSMNISFIILPHGVASDIATKNRNLFAPIKTYYPAPF